MTSVADKIAAWLAEKHIQDVFGVIGSGNMALWDAIALRGDIALHCTHSEQAAAQAAIFYHRTCGRHAAVLVTTGAGSSNVVTGVLCAWMDSVPLLVLAGNEPTKFLEQQVRAKGAQGYAFIETLGPIVVWSVRLTPNDPTTKELLNIAYEQMLVPRQGPVVVEIPIDVQNNQVEE